MRFIVVVLYIIWRTPRGIISRKGKYTNVRHRRKTFGGKAMAIEGINGNSGGREQPKK